MKPPEVHAFKIRHAVLDRLKKLKERLLREGVPAFKRTDDSMTVSGVIDIALGAAEDYLNKRKK